MANAKDKGNRYENDRRKALESAGLPKVVRNTQYDQRYKDRSDVEAPGGTVYLPSGATLTRPTLVLECKCHKALPGKRVLDALAQAQAAKQASHANAGEVVAAAVFHLHNTTRDVVLMEWPDFIALLKPFIPKAQ